MKNSKCFFCEKEATHWDALVNQEECIIADVCLDHLSIGLVS